MNPNVLDPARWTKNAWDNAQVALTSKNREARLRHELAVQIACIRHLIPIPKSVRFWEKTK